MEQHLDPEQLEQVRAAFTLFDHDGDGKVTIEELRLLYTSLGQNFSEAELRDFLVEVDSDGSGTIEWEEFLALMVRQLKGATEVEREQGLRNAFEAMDSDQDGFVTLVEFKQLMTNIGTSEDDVEKLVAAMDVDGDGRVSYQEYLYSFRSYNREPGEGFGFTTIPCPVRRSTSTTEEEEDVENGEEVFEEEIEAMRVDKVEEEVVEEGVKEDVKDVEEGELVFDEVAEDIRGEEIEKTENQESSEEQNIVEVHERTRF